MKKKILSIVMAVLMILGLTPVFPMTAYAATVPVTTEGELINAISAASAGDIIGLTQDITLTADLTINKNVTIASAGAKLIAGANRIIIPLGSSVSFGGTLGITGNTATGYNDGLVVVQGDLTLFADQVSITNSHASYGNSNAIYIVGGTLDIQGGTVSDNSTHANPESCGIYLNGGNVALGSGGSAIAVNGSRYGIYARNGADVSIYAGSVAGSNTGIFFNGEDAGGVYISGGSVAGGSVGLSVYRAASNSGSGVSGGTVSGTSSCGIIADESTLAISGGMISGNSASGAVCSQVGSTINISRSSALTVTGGIRCADGNVGGTTFLSSLPDTVSLPVDTDGSVSLSLGSTTFALDTAKTAASLGASYSGGTVSLHPTAVSASLPLVVKSSVTWNDGDTDLTETLNLTIPVTVTGTVDLPVLTNVSRSNIGATTAKLSASVYSDGGAAVSEYGFVYSTSSAELEIGKPGVTTLSSADSGSAVTGNAAGFAANLTGLFPGTVYYVRAYAKNSAGTGYTIGSNSFTTAGTPEVTTGRVEVGTSYGLAWNQMYVYGNVTSEGAEGVTGRGIVYTTVYGSSGSDNLIMGGTNVTTLSAQTGGAGEYSVQINDLTNGTTYYYRAYATNSEGTSYGEIKTAHMRNITIHVDTEDGGEVVIGEETAWAGAPDSTKGSLFWNGSAWVSNNTAAHMYFTDSQTGARLNNYTDVAIPAAAGASTQNGVGFTTEAYTYQVAAADGSGTYQYTGIKYTLTQADGKKIILLSRGIGRGTGTAHLEAFIENPTSGTLAIRDGSAIYSHTGTAAEAAAISNPTTGVMGLLRTADVYWFDMNGGSDMGGLTYSLHTEASPATLVTAAHPANLNQVARFDLMLMSEENALYRYILSPSLTSEIFIPITAPTVTGVSPTSVSEAGGTSVTITGTNFTGASAVKFGGSNAAYTVNSATQIVAVAPAGTGTVHITVTTADGTSATSNADRFTYTSTGGGGGGGSGTVTTTTYTADVQQSGVKTETLPVTVSGSGGTASLSETKAAALLDAVDATVIMPSIPGVSAYTLELPASALDAGQKGGALTVTTGFGSVTIPDNMLSSTTGANGKTAGITVGQGDTSGLSDAEKAAIGNRPLIQLTLTLDGARTAWSNPAAPVTVTITYTPTATELKSPESILIWYLDGSGNPVCVPNGHYDAATGTVTFTTTHFSRYAVGYNPVSFNDVASGAWYHSAVSFIAARGITTGTGNNNFSPGDALTRGQFIVMLMRTYGIAPDASPTDNFADAGSTYYTNYLAAAKRLGIAKGVGNNMYAPGNEITRQEMFTLLYNALNFIGQLPQSNSGKTLADFNDADRIAPWAQEAMRLLVETGTVSGSGGKLNPTGTTTRAEMAQVLYNLLMQ